MCISDISTSISTDFGDFTAVQISESLSGSLPTWRPLTAAGVASCSYIYISSSIQTKDRYNNCEDLLYMYIGTGSLSHYEMPRRRVTTEDGFDFNCTNDQEVLVWMGGSTNNNAFVPIENLPVGTKLVTWHGDIYSYVRITENRHMCNIPATASLRFKDVTSPSIQQGQQSITLTALTDIYPYSRSRQYVATGSQELGQGGNATLSINDQVMVFNTFQSESFAQNFIDAVNSANGHAGTLVATRDGANHVTGTPIKLAQTRYTASTPLWNITHTAWNALCTLYTSGVPFSGGHHGYNEGGQYSDEFDNWRCDSNGVSIDFTVGGSNSYQLKNGVVLKGFTGELCSCGPDASILEYPCESTTSVCVSESIEFRFSGSDTGDHKEWTVTDSATGTEILSSNFIYTDTTNPFGYTQSGNFSMQLGDHTFNQGTASIAINLSELHYSASTWSHPIGPSNQLHYIYLHTDPDPAPIFDQDWLDISGSALGAVAQAAYSGQPEFWVQIGLTASAPPYQYTPCINWGIFPSKIIAQVGANATASAVNLAKAFNDAYDDPITNRWLYHTTASAQDGKLVIHARNPGTLANDWTSFVIQHFNVTGLGVAGSTTFYDEWYDPLTMTKIGGGFSSIGAPVSGTAIPAPTHMTLSWYNSSSNFAEVNDTQSANLEYKLPQVLNVCWEEATDLGSGLIATSSCCAMLQLNKQPYSTSTDDTACQLIPGLQFPMSDLGLENYDEITYGLESGGGHFASASISMSYEATASAPGTASNTGVFAKESSFVIAANGVDYEFMCFGVGDVVPPVSPIDGTLSNYNVSTNPVYYYYTGSTVDTTVAALAARINTAYSGTAPEAIGNLVEAVAQGAKLDFTGSNHGVLPHSFTFKTGAYEGGPVTMTHFNVSDGFHGFAGGVNPTGSMGVFIDNSSNTSIPYDIFIPDQNTYQQGVFDIDYTASVSNSLCLNSASGQPSYSAPWSPTVEPTPGCCTDISGTITLVANPGLEAGKDGVFCWPTMSLQAIGPLFNFPELGEPTWSIAGATLNDGSTYDASTAATLISTKLYFGKNTATDSHSLSTELYLNDKNYCGLYTMSLSISHSDCGFTDTAYIKMVSLSLSPWPSSSINYCLPLEDDAMMNLAGPAVNATGYWTHVNPPTPNTSPGNPLIFSPTFYKSTIRQDAGSTCTYRWTETSTSVHELGGIMHSVTCEDSAITSVTVDDNPGAGGFILPDTKSYAVGGLEPSVYYIGGGGCCPANNEKFISRSFEMSVPGLALNTPVTLSVFNNTQYGYDNHLPLHQLRGVVMGFGSGSGTGASGLDSYNRIIQNSRSSFLYNATNSAFSHSEDIINTANITTFGSYTSSKLWFRSEFSSSYHQAMSMSFSVPGEMGVCLNNTTAELVALPPWHDFDIHMQVHPTAFYITDPQTGESCIKAGNVSAVNFMSCSVKPRSSESSIITREGSVVIPSQTVWMGRMAPFVTVSYDYCEEITDRWQPIEEWNNSGSGQTQDERRRGSYPRYSWRPDCEEGGAAHSGSAAAPVVGGTPLWPFIMTQSGHLHETVPQPAYISGSGIVTSSFGIPLTSGSLRAGGNNYYHPNQSPKSHYGLGSILFEWNAELLAGYDENGSFDGDSSQNKNYWGCFADTWTYNSKYESPTYFPPIRMTHEDGSLITVDGWPTKWGSEPESVPSGPDRTGHFGGKPSNFFYSASVRFSVTASPVNRPDMRRYATCSVMFVSQALDLTTN